MYQLCIEQAATVEPLKPWLKVWVLTDTGRRVDCPVGGEQKLEWDGLPHWTEFAVTGAVMPWNDLKHQDIRLTLMNYGAPRAREVIVRLTDYHEGNRWSRFVVRPIEPADSIGEGAE